jgi:hypothetical protein
MPRELLQLSLGQRFPIHERAAIDLACLNRHP